MTSHEEKKWREIKLDNPWPGHPSPNIYMLLDSRC